MTEPLRTADDLVRVEYHQFWIAEDELPSLFGDYGNGLIELHPGAAAVHTGISTVPAQIHMELYTVPPKVDTEPWDEVAEFTLWSLEGELRVRALMDWTPEGLTVLSHVGEGGYRIRIHARGRDNNYVL